MLVASSVRKRFILVIVMCYGGGFASPRRARSRFMHANCMIVKFYLQFFHVIRLLYTSLLVGVVCAMLRVRYAIGLSPHARCDRFGFHANIVPRGSAAGFVHHGLFSEHANDMRDG